MSHRSTPRSRLARTVLPLVLVSALALAGCSGEPSPSATASLEPQSGGTITFGRAASVTSLDLNNEITANNAFAIYKIF